MGNAMMTNTQGRGCSDRMAQAFLIPHSKGNVRSLDRVHYVPASYILPSAACKDVHRVEDSVRSWLELGIYQCRNVSGPVP